MNNRIKECSGCGETRTIVHGWSTRFPKCQQCASKKEWKPIKTNKKVNPRPTHGRKANIDKDWEIGREIWAERPHVCVETGKSLGEVLQKIFLSHLMSKGAHPELRHDKRNIVLHSREAHNQWEFGDRRSMKTWKENIEWMVANGYVLQE